MTTHKKVNNMTCTSQLFRCKLRLPEEHERRYRTLRSHTCKSTFVLHAKTHCTEHGTRAYVAGSGTNVQTLAGSDIRLREELSVNERKRSEREGGNI